MYLQRARSINVTLHMCRSGQTQSLAEGWWLGFMLPDIFIFSCRVAEWKKEKKKELKKG